MNASVTDNARHLVRGRVQDIDRGSMTVFAVPHLRRPDTDWGPGLRAFQLL